MARRGPRHPPTPPRKGAPPRKTGNHSILLVCKVTWYQANYLGSEGKEKMHMAEYALFDNLSVSDPDGLAEYRSRV
jgi:hypothetical protein